MKVRKLLRDKFGRFRKRGQSIRPPQKRDKRGRYVARKKPTPVRKRKKTLKRYLSPKKKAIIPELKFRTERKAVFEGEEDDEGFADDGELEERWQDEYEDDFSALDYMDDLDNLTEQEDEWYEQGK